MLPPLTPRLELRLVLTFPVMKVCRGNLELSSAWELPINWSYRNPKMKVERRENNNNDCHLAVRTVLVVIIIVIIVLPVHIIAFILCVSLRSGREQGGQGQKKEEFEHDC